METYLHGGIITANTGALGDKWTDVTEKLHQYLRRDMSDTIELLQEAFPETWDQRQVIRPIPFVYRLARTLSTLYRKPPTREWEGVAPELQERARRIYAGIKVDWHMMALQEQLTAMNNAVLAVWPDMTRGRIGLMTIPPHHVHVVMGNQLSQDVRDAEAVYIKLPMGKHEATGLVSFSVCKITPESAIWVEGPDTIKNTGVWMADGSNPLGRIPLVILKGSIPDPGEFWAPANESLLRVQQALNMAYTDIGHVSMLQSYGQAVITGARSGHVENMVLGPESIIALPDDQMTFDYKTPQAPLDAVRQSVDSYMISVLAHEGHNPDRVLQRGQGAISAVAKAGDNIQRSQEQVRHQILFRDAEQEVWSLVRRWRNFLNGSVTEVYPSATVKVTFHEIDQPIDELHRAQSCRMESADGLRSAPEELMRRKGIGRKEAEELVRQNLETTRELREQLQPDGRLEQGRPVGLAVADDV